MNTTSLSKVSVLLLVFIFMLNSCTKDDNAISYDLTGSWKVLYFIDGDKKITKSKDNTWPDINKGDITANFTEPDSSGKGTISGIRVTNRYNGDYTIQKNGEIVIAPISTTYISEPEWTALFHISSAEHYEIKNAMLFIYYGNNKNSIAFERN